jgi:hypothetical protein
VGTPKTYMARHAMAEANFLETASPWPLASKDRTRPTEHDGGSMFYQALVSGKIHDDEIDAAHRLGKTREQTGEWRHDGMGSVDETERASRHPWIMASCVRGEISQIRWRVLDELSFSFWVGLHFCFSSCASG